MSFRPRKTSNAESSSDSEIHLSGDSGSKLRNGRKPISFAPRVDVSPGVSPVPSGDFNGMKGSFSSSPSDTAQELIALQTRCRLLATREKEHKQKISDLEESNEALREELSRTKEEQKEQTEQWEAQRTKTIEDCERVKFEMEVTHKTAMEDVDRNKREVQQKHSKAIEELKRENAKQKKLIDKLQNENDDLKDLIEVQDRAED